MSAGDIGHGTILVCDDIGKVDAALLAALAVLHRAAVETCSFLDKHVTKYNKSLR
jgi:hypothetical protein